MEKAKKTIGMLVAVEIGAVLSRYGDKLTDVSETGFDVKRLDSDDYTMYILKSGAGEIAAAAGTQFLITKYGAEFIINFGVVGGLTPEMSLAKTCVVESVVHYDFDTSTIDNCEVGRYLEYPSIYIPAPRSLWTPPLRPNRRSSALYAPPATNSLTIPPRSAPCTPISMPTYAKWRPPRYCSPATATAYPAL